MPAIVWVRSKVISAMCQNQIITECRNYTENQIAGSDLRYTGNEI